MATNAACAATLVRALEASIAGNSAVISELSTTHSGPLEIDDETEVEATGTRVTMHAVAVAEFEGDKISLFCQYWDEVELVE